MLSTFILIREMKKVVFIICICLMVWISVTIVNQAISLTSYRISNLVRFKDKYFGGPYRSNSLENATYSSGKLLCLIFTYPKNINKTLAIKNTWAKRCDKQLYFSNKTLPNIPTVILNMTESRQLLARKTRLAFQYVYDNYIDEFEWFLKADDDVYIIMENLKNFLSAFDPSDKLLFGKKFSKFKGKTYYMSGGAGYILSKSSVKILVEECFHTLPVYFKHIEDMAIGTCAEKYNFTAPDTRDSLGKERFHSLAPWVYLDKSWKPEWLDKYSVNPLKWGLKNLSNETISFHYMTPVEIQLLEFYLYTVNTKHRDQ